MYNVIKELIKVQRNRFILDKVDPRIKILVFISVTLLSYYNPVSLALPIAIAMMIINMIEYDIRFIKTKIIAIATFSMVIGFIVLVTPPDPVFSAEAIRSSINVSVLIVSIGLSAIALLQSIRYIDLYVMLGRSKLKILALVYISALRSLAIVGKLMSALIDSIRIYESRSSIGSYIKMFEPSKLEPLIHTLIVYSSYMGYYIEVRLRNSDKFRSPVIYRDRLVDAIFITALVFLIATSKLAFDAVLNIIT